ncbi:MAG: hypothetical protein C0504_00105 [Candidatus Solibacter sp.]|nr:hypothetical protein [Candidatus Solibacter sp.]
MMKLDGLKVNSAAAAASAVWNSCLMLVAYPLYLRYLSMEEYGVWLVMAVVLSLAPAANLGIGPAMTKLVSQHLARGELTSIQSTLCTALTTVAGVGIALTLAAAAASDHLVAAMGVPPTSRLLAQSLLPAVAVLSAISYAVEVQNGVLSGSGRMYQSVLIQSFNQTTTLAFSVGLLALGFGLKALIAGSLLGSCAALATSRILSAMALECPPSSHRRRLPAWDTDAFRGLMRIGFGLTLSSVIGLLLNPLNKLFISNFAGVAQVPIYEISMSAAMRLRGLLEAAVQAIMPEVSRLGALQSAEGRRQIASINRAALVRLGFIGLIVMAIPFVAASRIIPLWLGPSVDPSLAISLRICIAGAYISLLGTPSYYTLIGIGQVREIVSANLIQSGVNVAACLGILAFAARMRAVDAASCAALGMVCGSLFLIWRNTPNTRSQS